MKRKDIKSAMCAGMLIGLFSHPSSAADAADNLKEGNTRNRDSTTQTTPANLNRDRNLERGSLPMETISSAVKATDIVGQKVVNFQDSDLGKVSELGIDLESGRVAVVIIQSGGVFGLGAKNIAVPPRALSYDHAEKVLKLDIDKERFKNAQEFELNKWEDVGTSESLRNTYRYHQQQPYFDPVVPSNSPSDLRNQGNTTRGQTDATSPSQSPTARNQADTTRPSESDLTRSARVDQSFANSPKLGRIEKSSRLIGMSVINKANEKCGDVDNLIVDLPMGRVIHVVVSSGGFLGLGDTLNAIPPSEFQYSAGQDNLILDVTKDQLTKAPNFKKSDWPNFKDPQYSSSVYRSYGETPYFQTDADNTARNVRDRQGNTPTPLDQGSSDSDIQTTRQIRQALMDEQGLSVNARNIKIITTNGKVTVRGPVNDNAEKEKVAEVVRRITQNTTFDNQIEIKREGTKE